MNTGIYRIVFNRSRGLLMVAGELAKSAVKDSVGKVRESVKHARLVTTIKPLVFASWLAAGWVYAPLSLADIVADTSVSGHQTQQVINTANGTPQINIRTPNQNGLSHNSYTQFDVDRQGAILNNARTNTQTQQAGLITGNPNLTGGTARVILNEVNSADPSVLNGYLEVAGDRADVIVANPAGITCSGCGFINAQQTTLTTGRPQIANGNLMGYRVTQGQVNIGRGGLNTEGSDYTHIIARSVQVNADIVANNLKITAGTNEVSVNNETITPIDGNDLNNDEDAPEFAIDVAALGGMYAGHIHLIGTEEGVGVRNAGEIGASVGEFTLTADGRLENTGRMVAEADLNITIDGLTNTRIIHSEDSVQIDSSDSVSNTGTIDANAALSIDSEGQLTNSSRISADEAVSISSTADVTNSGQIDSEATIELSSDSAIQNSGSVLASETVDVSAQSFTQTAEGEVGAGLHANGSIRTDENFDVTIATEESVNLGGNQLASGELNVTANNIDLSNANQQADTVDLDANVAITGTGFQQTADEIQLDANSIHLSEADSLADNITATARSGNLTLSDGQLIAQENLSVSASNEFNNLNHSLSANTVSVTGNDITNTGTVDSGTQTYIASTGQITNSGLIASEQTTEVTSNGDMTNTGTVLSDGSLTVTSQSTLNNSGAIIAQTTTTVSATEGITQTDSGQMGAGIAEDGSIRDGDDENFNLTVTTEGDATLGGTQLASGDVSITANNIALTNGGQQADTLDLNASTQLSTNNVTQTADEITMDAGTVSLSNSDTLANTVTVNATSGNLSLNDTTLISTSDLNLHSAQTVDNQGSTVNSEDLTVTANQLNNNQGASFAQTGTTTITTTGAINNNGGTLEGNGDVTLESASLSNQSGTISSATDLTSTQTEGQFDNQNGTVVANTDVTITSAGVNNSQGLIQANQDLTLNSVGLDVTNTQSGDNGGLIAGNDLTVTANDLDNTSGYVAAGNDVTATLNGNLTNTSGQIFSVNDGTVTANAITNTNGDLQSGNDLELTLSGDLANQGGYVQANNTLTVSADDIDNQNTDENLEGLEAQTITATATTLDNDNGQVIGDNVNLTVRNWVSNINGLFSATGVLNLSAEASAYLSQLNNDQGRLVAGRELNLFSQDLLGQGSIESAGSASVNLTGDYVHSSTFMANSDFTLMLTGNFTNDVSAIFQANNDLTITAVDITNNTGATIEGENTRLTASGTLNNYGFINSVELTRLEAQTLNNVDGARIYGNTVAIQANTLNNTRTTTDVYAPVIASRQDMHLAVNNLTNEGVDALITSLRNLTIAGQLNENNEAIGRANVITNRSGTIEADNNLAITANTIANEAAGFDIVDGETTTTSAFYYQHPDDVGNDELRYGSNEVQIRQLNGQTQIWFPLHGWTYSYYIYNGESTFTERELLPEDPGTITAGGHVTLAATTITNDNSRIVAGGNLDAVEGSIVNNEEPVRNLIEELGDRIYRYATSSWDENLGTVWTVTTTRTDYNIRDTEASTAIGGTDEQGQAVTVDGQSGNTAPDAIAAIIAEAVDENALEDPEATTIDAVESPTDNTDRDQSSSAQDDFDTIRSEIGDNGEIRTLNLSNLTTSSSLFTLNAAVTANVLIETDPQFINTNAWLSSEYMLLQLNNSTDALHKRLGDGYYEQRLVREQLIQLTGQRNRGYADEEQQFQALMDAGVAFAEEYNLIPGVSLSAEQMLALTSDIIWLELETVTLPDGSTEEVLVPRVYALVRPGDVDGQGALLSGANVKLNGDSLVNSGTITGRQGIVVNQGNMEDLRGRLQANTIDVTATEDITLTGSQWSARDRLNVHADRDLTIQRETHTEDTSGGSRSLFGTPTWLRVWNERRGSMELSSNRDTTIAGSKLENQGDGDTIVRAGNNLDIGATQAGHTFNNGRSASQVVENIGTDIDAGGRLKLLADNNLNFDGSRANAEGDVIVRAGNDLSIGTTTDKDNYHAGGRRNTLSQNSEVANSSQIASGKNLSVEAGKNLSASGAQLSAAEELALSGENVSLTTGINTNKSYEKVGRKKTRSEQLTHTLTTLDGNNVSINANEDLTLIGTNVDADNNIALNANGDTTIRAAQDENYSYYYQKKKKSWGRSKTTIEESLRTTNVGGELTASNGNLTINAEINGDGSVSGNESSGQVLVQGATLSAMEQVAIAGDNVIIADQKELSYHRKETHKKGFGGLSSKSKGRINRQEILQASQVIAEENNLDVISASDITILGSDLKSGGSMNLEAVDDILITADQILEETKEWSMETGFLSSLDSVYEREDHIEGSVSSTAVGSSLQAENININASRATIVGSDLSAEDSIRATTDVGDIQVLSADQSNSTYEKHTSVKVGLSDIAEQMLDIEGQLESLFDPDEGQAKLSIAKATYDQVDTKTNASDTRASSLLANGNIELNAAGDIEVQGSDLVADYDQNEDGNIDLTAGGDVSITESGSVSDTKTKEIHGEGELSVVVQHQAVEVVKAVRALDKAKDQLKQADEDYRQYKKDLKKLKKQRDKLREEFVDGVPGVSYEDMLELNELIHEVESDEEWYQAGIALAAANLASKVTLLVQQTAAAAASVATYGFNAGVQLDLDATTIDSQQYAENSRASYLAGNNINIRTGNDNNIDDSNTLIRGSDLQASDTINITTGELNIEASRDDSKSKTETENAHIRIAQTVYGAAGGPTVSVDYNRSRSKDRNTTYNNSTLNAENINLSSTGDTTVKGANIHATDTLNADVGGNLHVQSMQNKTSANSNSAGISAGFGFGSNGNDGKTASGAVSSIGKSNGQVSSVSGGLNAGNSRTRLTETVLTNMTGGNVNINVEGHTGQVGSVIAAVDEDGNDNGNLTLNTQSYDYANLSNTAYSSEQSGGISTSIGLSGSNPNDPNASGTDTKLNTTNLNYTNNLSYDKSKALATLGDGDVTIRDDIENGTDSTDRLNRDLSNTEKDLFSHSQSQSIEVTIDTRLLTESGRDQIAEDILKTGMMVDAISDIVESEKLTAGDFRSEVQKNLDTYDAVKERIAKDPTLAAALQDPDLPAKQKQEMLNSITDAVMIKLGYTPHENNVIATTETGQDGQQVAGFFSEETGNTYINDVYNNNTKELVVTAGHEASHVMDYQDGEVTENAYAEDYGRDLATYTNRALDMAGHNGGLASTNNHIGNNTSATIRQNNTAFNQLDKNQGDNRQFTRPEAQKLDQARAAIRSRMDLTPQQKQQLLTVLEATACAEIKCSAGIPKGDRNKMELSNLEELGNQLINEQGISIENLLSDLKMDTIYQDTVTVSGGGPLGWDREIDVEREAFTYSSGDAITDGLSSSMDPINKIVANSMQSGLEYGVAGITDAAGLVSDNMAGFSDFMYDQAGETANTTYESQIGNSVLNSFSEETWQDEPNYALESALTLMEVAPIGAAAGQGVKGTIRAGQQVIKQSADDIAAIVGQVDEVPISGFDEIYSKAPDAKIEIDSIADNIANELGGDVAKAPIKSPERAIEKIVNDYDGDPSRIKDLARNTIIVDADKIDGVVDALNAQGANIKRIDGSADPLGYSGVNSSLKTKSGVTGEIQVNTPEMIFAKEPEDIARQLLGNEKYDSIATNTGIKGGEGHKLYEKWRILDPDSTEARNIADKSRAYYNSIRNTNPAKASGGTSSTYSPKVTAEAEVDGLRFNDTNQGSRPPELANPNKPTLIADDIQIKIEKNPDKPFPNGNMATAHAEVGAIQQAFDAGKTQGKNMTMRVTGEDVCDYCRSDLRKAANKAGLNSLSIYEETSGKTLTWTRREDGTMGKVKLTDPEGGK